MNVLMLSSINGEQPLSFSFGYLISILVLKVEDKKKFRCTDHYSIIQRVSATASEMEVQAMPFYIHPLSVRIDNIVKNRGHGLTWSLDG